MSIISEIFSKTASDVTKSIGDVIDGVTTTDEEKLKVKERLLDITFTALNTVLISQKDIIVAEANGSKLQRNWRPIVMLSFAFILVYEYFIAKVFNLPTSNLPEKFFTLLEIGLGGYVIGRSVEKVAETISKNIDMPFLKKKERKIEK